MIDLINSDRSRISFKVQLLVKNVYACRARVVKIKMNGFKEDMSDEDDAVKSGSATGFSDHEMDERSPLKFHNRYDPVNVVLDKIDAELSSLSRSQSSNETGSTVVNRSGSHGNRSNSSNHDELTTSQLEKSGSSIRSTSSQDRQSPRNGLRGHNSSRQENKRHISGSVEMYKEPLTNGKSSK
ncbi:hypothetical protein FSP39_010835 [Pinctada imbricata]|uniref:Uncharacterized protein n=1 Tax=Pinctada imbricata TaxID=66713 RepID=A0AA88XW98_PINIB|nr:hypothetical protein FSP39_010835 [Pinctada imbricata]